MNFNLHLYYLSLTILLSSFTVAQAPTLNLEQALEKGLNRTDLQAIFASRVNLAESGVVTQRAWENPSLALLQETDNINNLHTEERFLSVTQRVPLFNSRRYRVRAAQHEKTAVAFENQAQALQFEAQIKTHFFATLLAQERRQVLQNWLDRLRLLFRQVQDQEKLGHTSGLERRLLEREMIAARGLVAKEKAHFDAEWHLLAGWLRIQQPRLLVGQLLPDKPKPIDLTTWHPSLLALEESKQAALLQEKAASHWILPEITLQAGVKQVESGGLSDTGTVIGATVPLPVLNRNKASLMQARAKARLAQEEQTFAQSQQRARRNALRNQLNAHLELHETLHQKALHISQDLVRITEIAYNEGEISLNNLIETLQAIRDAQLDSLEFQAETRTLAIELEQWEGQP